MSTLSKRLQTQTYFEHKLGCYNPQNFKQFLDDLKNYEFDITTVDDISPLLKLDGTDLFYKGMISLLQGLMDIKNNCHAWATVKLYYSVFYFIRTSLALNGFVIVKNNGFHCSPNLKKSLFKKYNVRGDHKAAIKIYTEKLGDSDILLGNKIDNTDSYLWLMGRREEIQYRCNSFYEPDYWKYYSFLEEISYIEALKLFIEDDEYKYCFDEDFACIALPVKRFLLTLAEFKNEGLTLEQNKKDHLMKTFSVLFKNSNLKDILLEI